MDGASLQANLQLPADQPHELLGEGNRWRLQLSGTTPISQPLTLQIAGVDQRGNARAEPMAVGTAAGAIASRPAGEGTTPELARGHGLAGAHQLNGVFIPYCRSAMALGRLWSPPPTR